MYMKRIITVILAIYLVAIPLYMSQTATESSTNSERVRSEEDRDYLISLINSIDLWDTIGDGKLVKVDVIALETIDLDFGVYELLVSVPGGDYPIRALAFGESELDVIPIGEPIRLACYTSLGLLDTNYEELQLVRCRYFRIDK